MLKNYKEILIAGGVAVPLGILIGIIDTVFGKILISITGFRQDHAFLLIPFLALAGLLIVFLYQKFGGKSQRGMSQVFDVAFEKEKNIPPQLVPLIMFSTWITHLFGGSAGREGVAVQIGATVSHSVGRFIPIKNAGRIFLITGMAAGFAGLFGTPLAAVCFALEVMVVGSIAYEAIFPALIGAFCASMTSSWLGLEKFEVAIKASSSISILIVLKLMLLGLIFGLTGALFTFLLGKSKSFFGSKFKNPYIRIVIVGACLSLIFLLLHGGRYSGLGTNLISASFSGGSIYSYDWILKTLLTVITLGVGFQGGEVTPLFSIGASLGIFIGPFFGIPVELTAALGYAAVFGSATNTLFAPIFIGAEVFGFQFLPYFFIVCVIAYICNGNKSIYGSQKTNNMWYIG